MTVREAINLLAYGQPFYIIGSHSGKIYHKSYINKAEHLEKYMNEQVTESPFFTDLYMNKKKYGSAYTYPIIGIWMTDYNLSED